MISTVLLVAALALAPVIGGGLGDLTNSILQLLVFGSVTAHIIFSRKRSDAWVHFSGFWPLIAFGVLVLLSALSTESIYASIRQILFFSACLGSYVLGRSIFRDSKTATAALWALITSALCICGDGIHSYAISTGGGSKFWQALLSPGEHMRLFGPFINPGFFAGFLVIAILITFGAYLSARRPLFSFVAGLALGVEAVSLMLTGTKFAVVAAAVALLSFFVLAAITRSIGKAQLPRLCIITIVMIPLLILFSAPLTSRVKAAEQGGTQVHSAEFRKYTWIATVHMIRANPWLGTGPGTFETAYPRYTIAYPTKNAHQSYLQIASETGVPALLALLGGLMAIMLSAAVGIWKSPRVVQESSSKQRTDEQNEDTITWQDLIPADRWRLMGCAIFAALIGSGIRSLADSDWYIVGIALPFWILAGLLVAQFSPTSKNIRPNRSILFAASAILGILSISLGAGDAVAPEDMQMAEQVNYRDIMSRYQLATKLSPLNPQYHRELGKMLAFVDNDATSAQKEFNTAIRLSPKDRFNYDAKGMVALRNGDRKAAIRDMRKALEMNPKSTQSLYRLAEVYKQNADIPHYESTLRRLLSIENSPYEQIKGAPEIVDTSYARAHFYFGQKLLRNKEYSASVRQFSAAIHRLEMWRSDKQILKMSKMMGILSAEEEHDLLCLLRDSYYGLADAYAGLGNFHRAQDAKEKAGIIKTD